MISGRDGLHSFGGSALSTGEQGRSLDNTFAGGSGNSQTLRFARYKVGGNSFPLTPLSRERGPLKSARMGDLRWG